MSGSENRANHPCKVMILHNNVAVVFALCAFGIAPLEDDDIVGVVVTTVGVVTIWVTTARGAIRDIECGELSTH
jgi:hypothetical protein